MHQRAASKSSKDTKVISLSWLVSLFWRNEAPGKSSPVVTMGWDRQLFAVLSFQQSLQAPVK